MVELEKYYNEWYKTEHDCEFENLTSREKAELSKSIDFICYKLSKTLTKSHEQQGVNK